MKKLAVGSLSLGLVLSFATMAQDETPTPDQSELLSRLAPSIAYGPDDHHWHVVAADKKVFVVADAHRVEQVEGTNHRQLPMVAFMSKRSERDGVPADYVALLVETDCAVQGRFRGVAAVFYTSDGTSSTAQSAGELEDGWLIETEGAMPVIWEWACEQAPQRQAMPANQGFDEMLANYREALSWSSAGLK